MTMITCPACRGSKVGFAVMCSEGKCRTGSIACSVCNGAGQISSELAERMRKGDVMRKTRVKRGITIMQQADFLGVDPKLLNDVEFGRLPMEEVINPKLVKPSKHRLHLCPEWDYDLIDDMMPEFGACRCSSR